MNKRHKTKYLNNINSPDDLRKLNLHELELLSREIRRFLLQSISETGGHLASNLGVVELTIALHYLFDTPDDKIIWDVGHQAYVHKILTGRRKLFNTLRKLGGLSGFPKTGESIYDAFDTGHSSTSVSVALGIAVARDLSGKKNKIVAVIGDGSMTGGLAYEALNNAGRSETDILVILNDNEMSIAENVGALSSHLNDIRTAPSYLNAKRDVHRFLDKVPGIGKPASEFIERVKDGIKYFFVPGVLFEELGFTYIGIVDGHNLNELIRVISKCKQIKGPVLLHVYTQKGHGYRIAEMSPEKYHGVDGFDIKTGDIGRHGEEHQTPYCSFSGVFGDKLTELAGVDKRIVAVTASMAAGTGLSGFGEKFPERLFDVGIAEGHAVTFCAGLAKNGMKPVFAVYSSFLQRGYDQILHDVCIQNLPVVFAIDRAGIVGADGETHQGIFDLSFLSHLPNMTILAPRDGAELCQMLEYAFSLKSPVAIRYPRDNANRVIMPEYTAKENSLTDMGRYEKIIDGEEIAVISVGAMCGTAYELCGMLKRNGKKTTLINARSVKPIDPALIDELAKYKHIITIEDNVMTGGFGCNLLVLMNTGGVNAKFHIFALPDKFIEHGTRTELLAAYGLDAVGIYDKINAAGGLNGNQA